MANEYAVNQADLTAVANAIREKGETSEQLVFPDDFVTAIGNISTGVELNFEVVGGTTQPSNPKENTIWINTDTEITGWAFSAAEPTDPISGMVFFETEGISSTEFNALKKNVLSVYPVSTSQYVGDAWEPKTAMIYQKGAWAELTSGMLYDTGNEFTALTGGWALSTTGSGTHGESLSKGTIRMYFSTSFVGGKNFAAGFLRCNKQLDLTDITDIYADLSDVSIASGIDIALVATPNDTYYAGAIRDAVARSDLYAGMDVVRLDVSGLTGKYWIGFAAEVGTTNTNGTSKFYVYKVAAARGR